MKLKFSPALILLSLLISLAALTLPACQASTATANADIKDISLSVSGVKSLFYLGDTFSTTGLIVNAVYTDKSKSQIELSECSFFLEDDEIKVGDPLPSETGKYSITVKYREFSKKYSITVADATVSYTAPTYKDNYTSISSWANKDQWNLSNTHDPTVFKWTDGYWYMFGTDASYGDAHKSATTGKHFQGKRSTDLVNWEWVPGVMDGIPDWLVTKLNEYREAQNLDPIAKADISAGYWAPCARVITVDGVTKVRMYYDIVVDNYIKTGAKTSTAFDGSWSERAFIGVMETTNPNGGPSAWTDLGYVLCSSSDRGPAGYSRESTNDWDAYFYFNAIDPTYFVDDDGSHWMIYGSWHSGFAIVRINPATGKVAAVDGDDYLTGNVTGDFKMGFPWSPNGTKDAPLPEELKAQGYGTRIYSRNPASRWQGSEGPELVKKGGYYWLFFANDGLDIPYQTRVVRAEKITGPYYDLTGRNFTSYGNGSPMPIVTHPYKFTDEEPASGGYGSCYGWVGISHCAVFNDGDDWYYMSQQRLPKDISGINASNALMMGGVRKIVWTPTDGTPDLWPIALPERYAGIPENYKGGTVTESELPGTWQHINLKYTSKGAMDVATELILNTDNTMSGALTGSWSFNSADQTLTFTPTSGTEVIVSVRREVDWEKVPRVPIIVYAGTQKDLGMTYWGKQDSQDGASVKTYAEQYANATLMSTYTMTIADDAKDDLAWYLYPQWGTWSYVVDEGDGEESEVASVTGTNAWWAGDDTNKGTKHVVTDGKTVAFYLWTTDSGCTMILHGYSATMNKYAGINYHNADDCFSDDNAVITSYTAGTNTAIAPNAAQSVKIEISRSGATQVAKIYQK